MTRVGWLLGCALLVAGCGGGGLQAHAAARAERQLRCNEPALRVRAIGELELLPHAPVHVAMFEASGCDQERVYYCMSGEALRCDEHVDALPHPEAHAALARAERLLRSTTRSRCPGDEQRIVQESESLFRFEACDGDWLYHCRASGCDRLR